MCSWYCDVAVTWRIPLPNSSSSFEVSAIFGMVIIWLASILWLTDSLGILLVSLWCYHYWRIKMAIKMWLLQKERCACDQRLRQRRRNHLAWWRELHWQRDVAGWLYTWRMGHSRLSRDQCWNYEGPGRAPPLQLAPPLIGEKKQAPGGGLCPPIGLLLSETRAIKAGAAQR